MSKSFHGSEHAHHSHHHAHKTEKNILIAFLLTTRGSSFVIYEAIQRIIDPVKVNYDGMIIFAIIGLVINSIASYVTRDGDSLNQKSVNLHMLEDRYFWRLRQKI